MRWNLSKTWTCVVNVWLVLWFVGVVVEDSGVGFVEIGAGWLGVGDGVGDGRWFGAVVREAMGSSGESGAG